MSKPSLVSIVAVDGRDDSALLALAASVASGCDTRIATAIVDSAHEREIQIRPVDEFHRTTATGVAARVDGHTVVFGNAALFADLGLSVENLGDSPERLQRRGEQVLFVAVDGRTAGFLGVAAADVNRTLTDVMEDEMKDLATTADRFPNEVTGLPTSGAVELIELADGDRFELRIAPVTKRLGDAKVRMLAYNGLIPGPTLRVQQGSEVRVNVVNEGDLEATVHWHGLRLDNRYDGTLATQSPIPVGGRFEYRLTFPDPGIYWYHPHIREDYGQEMGLYGNIVVTPSEPAYWPPVHREVALTLDDVLVERGAVAPFSRVHPTYTAMGRFGNVLLVNGDPQLSLAARSGEVVRFYLTNTANTRVFNVELPGARLKLVGGDSGRVEHETFVDHIVIAPSERAIVDVLFDRPEAVTLVHRTPERIYLLATITVRDERAEPPLTADFEQLRTNVDMTTVRTQVARYLTAEPAKTLALVAEMDMPAPHVPDGAAVEYVCPMHSDVISDKPGRCGKCGMKLMPSQLLPLSPHVDTHGDQVSGEHHDHHSESRRLAQVPEGIEWEDDMVEVNRKTNPTNMRWKLIDRHTGDEGDAIDWRFTVGEQVKIRIVNEMDSDHPMHHPFHIHGAGRFVVLSRNGVEESNLVWKDTVLIKTGEIVDILLDVTHPGVWMAHCHIAEHHESGMMLRFRVDQ
jgi:FtsP/CotA-like multicopper oxidase with cupredoxin domain